MDTSPYPTFSSPVVSTHHAIAPGSRNSQLTLKYADAVPTVKGECLVTGCTSDDFLAVLQLSGFRKRWDPRFESGHMLQRYSQNSYAFHSEMKGFGWLVYPRDIVGSEFTPTQSRSRWTDAVGLSPEELPIFGQERGDLDRPDVCRGA